MAKGASSTVVTTVLVLLIACASVTGSGVANVQSDSPVVLSISSDQSASAGNTTTLTVNVDSSAEVYALQFTLTLNPSAATIESSDKGSYLSQNGSSVVIINQINGSELDYGETRIRTESGVTGTGTAATVDVAVPETISSDTLTVSLIDVAVVDPQTEGLETRVENQSVPISGVSSSPTESTDTTESGDDSSSATEEPPVATETPTSTTEDTPVTTSTESETPANTEASWETKVDDSVLEMTQGGDKAPVVVQVSTSAQFEQIASRLNESVLDDATVNRELRVIQAQVNQSQLSKVAAAESVQRVRYDRTADDSSSELTGSTESFDTEEPTTNSVDNTQTSEPTSEPVATTETGANGPGFGVLVTLFGVVMCVFIVRYFQAGD